MSKTTVDDTSSSIKYTGYWETGKDGNSTVHSAWDPNSEAIFSFKGTHVAVYGIIPDGDGEVVRVDFSIDSGAAVPQTRRSGERKVMNELWWESDALPDGDHTLVMTYLPAAGVDMDFRLDFIEYTPSGAASDSTPPAQSSATASTATTVTTATQFLLPSSGSSSGEASGSSRSSTPVGAIVGGVIGGMLFLVLLALVFVLLRRRRRRAQAAIAAEGTPVSPFSVPAQSEASAASTTKPLMSQAVPGPGPDLASPITLASPTVLSSSKSRLASDAQTSSAALPAPSESALSYQSPSHEPNDPDHPPPAYDDHV
ncbi:hypothetical protein NMY22_g12689 [Coprinellus aureogranulatus]|nr:hypothetical protein NMY22_g12689 [Coprinellus aureogranulatus]